MKCLPRNPGLVCLVGHLDAGSPARAFSRGEMREANLGWDGTDVMSQEGAIEVSGSSLNFPLPARSTLRALSGSGGGGGRSWSTRAQCSQRPDCQFGVPQCHEPQLEYRLRVRKSALSPVMSCAAMPRARRQPGIQVDAGTIANLKGETGCAAVAIAGLSFPYNAQPTLNQ